MIEAKYKTGTQKSKAGGYAFSVCLAMTWKWELSTKIKLVRTQGLEIPRRQRRRRSLGPTWTTKAGERHPNNIMLAELVKQPSGKQSEEGEKKEEKCFRLFYSRPGRQRSHSP